MKNRKNNQKVAIVMGSQSDYSTMQFCEKVLKVLKIKFETKIVSAHRTPDRMYQFARFAEKNGISVIVAGAGGSAHLPGMIAALTSIPVIGVPIMTNAFQGNDSLLSIVQMPRGVPVATVAIGNATNAALLAVRILSIGNNKRDKELMQSLDKFILQQEIDVLQKVQKLERNGYREYLR